MLKKAASDATIDAQTKINNTVFINSRYQFLRSHLGLRPRTLHGIISNTGAGKTTLIKCIAAETAGKVPIMIWLSEETVPEYQRLINEIDKSILDNVVFVEEKAISDEHKSNQDVFFQYFENMVVESGARMVFVDNITTSLFYNSKFGFYGQGRTTDFLIGFVKRVCSVFYVAHTSSYVTDNYSKVIVPEDIRGNKELGLQTEYRYTVQKLTQNENIYNILRNAKHRHHEKAGGFFSLAFAKGFYVGDSQIPFEMVNYIFQKRDFLGKRIPKTGQEPSKAPSEGSDSGPLI